MRLIQLIVDPETLGVTGTSHYAELVDEARRQLSLAATKCGHIGDASRPGLAD